MVAHSRSALPQLKFLEAREDGRTDEPLTKTGQLTQQDVGDVIVVDPRLHGGRQTASEELGHARHSFDSQSSDPHAAQRQYPEGGVAVAGYGGYHRSPTQEPTAEYPPQQERTHPYALQAGRGAGGQAFSAQGTRVQESREGDLAERGSVSSYGGQTSYGQSPYGEGQGVPSGSFADIPLTGGPRVQ